MIMSAKRVHRCCGGWSFGISRAHFFVGFTKRAAWWKWNAYDRSSLLMKSMNFLDWFGVDSKCDVK